MYKDATENLRLALWLLSVVENDLLKCETQMRNLQPIIFNFRKDGSDIRQR